MEENYKLALVQGKLLVDPTRYWRLIDLL